MILPDYLDRILPIIRAVSGDKVQLEKIIYFLETEILPSIEEEKITIPPKFEALVREIADDLSCKFSCHLNLETLELEKVTPNGEFELYEEDEENEESDEGEREFIPKYVLWDQVLSFEPLTSWEEFRIMENFAKQLKNKRVQDILIDILGKRKPFAHFNQFIHNSTYREQWFAYKNMAYDDHVREMIALRLREME